MFLVRMLHQILGRDKDMEKANHRGMCLNCCRHINDILVCGIHILIYNNFNNNYNNIRTMQSY